MALSSIRHQLQTFRNASTAPDLRRFVPEGSLKHILQTESVSDALNDPIFHIPVHKRESIASDVCDEYSKIFAILLELHREDLLSTFYENDISDARLPLEEKTLGEFIPNETKQFSSLQHEYLAYRFRKGKFHKRLSQHQILPFIRQKNVGRGGFSTVYKVRVPSTHQNFLEKTGSDVCSDAL